MIINNVHFENAIATKNASSYGLLNIAEIEYITAEAILATAYEARTQTLIELYKILEPGMDRQNAFIEIMERTYG